MILDPNRTSAHGFTLSDDYGRRYGDFPHAQPAPLGPGAASDALSASPAERKIKAAVAEGSATYRPYHPDFPVFLAKLARKADDDLSRREASQLLKLAGVDNLTAAHARTVRDAGIRSAIVQATQIPSLVAGDNDLETSKAATIHALRQRLNADLDALANARAAAGSLVPPSRFRHEVESQLRAVATRDQHADVLASLDSGKLAKWGNAIERAASVARDTLASASMNATLLLGPVGAIATVPAASVRGTVSKSAANWRDTQAVARELVASFRALTGRRGQPASDADFDRLASFAQNQFPTAAQASFLRRDALVFQPHLAAKREKIQRQSNQIDRLQGERMQARTLEHYNAIVESHKAADRLEKLATGGSRAFVAEDKSVLRLLGDYAQLCPQTISPSELRQLAQRNADVLLSTRVHPDTGVRTLREQFKARFEAQARTPLLDGNLDLRFRELAYVDDPAIGSRDRRAQLRAEGARYQEQSALQDKLDRLDAQCRQAVSALPSTRPLEEPALRDELLKRQKQDGKEAAKLHNERRKTEANFYRYQDDVRHFLSGRADLIDQKGAVARAITRPGSGLFLRVKEMLEPENKSSARLALAQTPVPAAVPARPDSAAMAQRVEMARLPANALPQRHFGQAAPVSRAARPPSGQYHSTAQRPPTTAHGLPPTLARGDAPSLMARDADDDSVSDFEQNPAWSLDMRSLLRDLGAPEEAADNELSALRKSAREAARQHWN